MPVSYPLVVVVMMVSLPFVVVVQSSDWLEQVVSDPSFEDHLYTTSDPSFEDNLYTTSSAGSSSKSGTTMLY